MTTTNNRIGVALVAGALTLAGVGLYALGAMNAREEPVDRRAGPAEGAVSPAGVREPDAATVDPSLWGIPEGEAATRRHVREGLGAGGIDPVTGREILYYHDPMVPGKKFDAPGESPFMDMMLVPAYAGAGGADASTVTVSPRVRQNLGVRTGKVTEAVLANDIVAVGSIAWNERDVALVQARATGYVEKAYVRATLDEVDAGDPLFEVHVPEWVAVQEDYLAVRRMRGSDLGPLADAALQRMRQAGMSDAQVALVERSDRVQPRSVLVAPIDGVLTELDAREGSTVVPGQPLARINGLATVWAEAQVPESQAARVRVGSPVLARSQALPAREFTGTVQAILPEVDVGTRTVRVRTELENPEALLVPGMFVQMTLADGADGAVLSVPSEAVIRTGRRDIVMTMEADGSFRPVEVELGRDAGARTQILAGLEVGEDVVLSGQFLLDSEASLKGVEARSGAATPDGAPQVADADAGGGEGATELHRTTATIEAVDGDVLTLVHTPVESLGWPAMTMGFRLGADAAATGADLARAGRRVDVEFRMDDEGPVIESLDAAADDASGANPGESS